MHGYAIELPAGWRVRPATELWTAGLLDVESPAADVIFDPAHGNRLYLAVASQPYGDHSADEWRNEIVGRLCPSGGAFGSERVDGTEAFAVACGDQGVMVFAEHRGYLIQLIVPSDDPALAVTYDWAWLKSVLGTIDLRPEDAVDPAPSAPPPAPSSPEPSTSPARPRANDVGPAQPRAVSVTGEPRAIADAIALGRCQPRGGGCAASPSSD